MKNTTYLICTLLLIVIDLLIAFGWGYNASKTYNKINELENKYRYLEFQNMQDKARYEREIDQCLDILKNKRWD